MSQRIHKVDGNHAEIVKKLRQHHISVHDTSAAGGGFPDLVIGHQGQNVLMEVKLPGEGLSLTPAQVDWHRKWRGQVVIVTSAAEALMIFGIRV